MVGDDVKPVEEVEIVSREIFENKYPDETLHNHAKEQRLAGIHFAAQNAACEEDRVRLMRLYERQRDAFSD